MPTLAGQVYTSYRYPARSSVHVPMLLSCHSLRTIPVPDSGEVAVLPHQREVTFLEDDSSRNYASWTHTG
eukprot:10719894-Alexandrium_andersonii.AAC.1